MNAAKRFLTGAAVAAGALGIGAGAFTACRQELSPGGQNGANGAVRKAAAARFNDGVYTFYFKNGREASGDCDGYSSDFGGKTTIYEWYQSEINKWEKRLLAAGVKPEMYRTSKSKHCWARFDTDLLYGTGLHKQGAAAWGEAYFRMNGKETKVSKVTDLKYARAGGDFGWESKRIGKYGRRSVSEAQKNRDAPGRVSYFTRMKGTKGQGFCGARATPRRLSSTIPLFLQTRARSTGSHTTTTGKRVTLTGNVRVS